MRSRQHTHTRAWSPAPAHLPGQRQPSVSAGAAAAAAPADAGPGAARGRREAARCRPAKRSEARYCSATEATAAAVAGHSTLPPVSSLPTSSAAALAVSGPAAGHPLLLPAAQRLASGDTIPSCPPLVDLAPAARASKPPLGGSCCQHRCHEPRQLDCQRQPRLAVRLLCLPPQAGRQQRQRPQRGMRQRGWGAAAGRGRPKCCQAAAPRSLGGGAPEELPQWATHPLAAEQGCLAPSRRPCPAACCSGRC